MRHPVDVGYTCSIIELFETELRGKYNVLLIESYTNPNSHIFEFDIVPN